jgi:hypothetical protein
MLTFGFTNAIGQRQHSLESWTDVSRFYLDTAQAQAHPYLSLRSGVLKHEFDT